MSRNAWRRAIKAKIALVTRRKAPCIIDPVHSVHRVSSQFLIFAPASYGSRRLGHDASKYHIFAIHVCSTTNTIEQLHEEFRRRVKTQGSRPSEDAALILLFSLVASGQIKVRRIDGGRKIAAVLSQHAAVTV